MQKKKREYVEAQKQVKKTFNNFNEFSDQNILQNNVQFTITSEVTHLIKMHEKLTKTTKKSIDVAMPVRCNEEIALQKFFPYLKGAMRRGVKVRIVTEGNDGENNCREPTISLSKNSVFELRYLHESSIQFGMHIFDDREVTLAISEINPCPSFWTNSTHVVKLQEPILKVFGTMFK